MANLRSVLLLALLGVLCATHAHAAGDRLITAKMTGLAKIKMLTFGLWLKNQALSTLANAGPGGSPGAGPHGGPGAGPHGAPGGGAPGVPGLQNAPAVSVSGARSQAAPTRTCSLEDVMPGDELKISRALYQQYGNVQAGHTLLAPTDDAWTVLQQQTAQKMSDASVAVNLLRLMTIPGSWPTTKMSHGLKLRTELYGESLTVSRIQAYSIKPIGESRTVLKLAGSSNLQPAVQVINDGWDNGCVRVLPVSGVPLANSIVRRTSPLAAAVAVANAGIAVASVPAAPISAEEEATLRELDGHVFHEPRE